MIKFFRHIRQRMIKENRVSKYLIYAIGEILLVVIGILIALEINNRNEYKQARSNEAVFLSNLNDEFLFNRNQFELSEVYGKTALHKMEALLGLFGAEIETVEIGYLDSLLYGVFTCPIAHLNDDVYSSLANSGKLELLGNPKLKSALLSWGSELRRFRRDETNMYQNLNVNVGPRMEDRISFNNLERFGELTHIPNSRILPDNRKVLNDPVAESIFFNHLWEVDHVLSMYPAMYAQIDEVLIELEKQLSLE